MRLPAGCEVQVLKVVHCAEKKQWRGWVEHPVHGWIVLLGTEDGSRWAERLSDESCSSTAEATGRKKNKALSALGSESSGPPVTTAAVILSREQSHRSRSVPKPSGATSNAQTSVITTQAVPSSPPRRSQSVPHLVQQPGSCGAVGVAGSQLRAASPLLQAGHAWHQQQVAGSRGASGSLSAAVPAGPPGTGRTASAQRAQPLESQPSRTVTPTRTLTPPPTQQPVARPSIAVQPLLRTAQSQLPNVQQQQQPPPSWQQQAQHRQVGQPQCSRAMHSSGWALPSDGPVEHQPSRARTAPLLAPASMRRRSPSLPGPAEQVVSDRMRSRERNSPHEPEASVVSNGQPGGREHELAMVISRLKGLAAQQSPRPYGSRRPPGFPGGADGKDGSEAGRGRDRGAKSLRWSDL